MVVLVGDLIKKSFRDIGALKMNEAPAASEIADALNDLNYILDQWSIESLMVLASIMENFPLTAGKYIYTIGYGQDFNTSKPSKIDNAFIQDALNVRYPCDIIDKGIYDTYEDSLISTARPTEIIYDPGPTQQTSQMGIIYAYPIPDASIVYTLFIGQQKPLTEFSGPTDTVIFQSAYYMALRYSLDEVLWPQYRDDGKPFPPHLKGMKARAMGNIVAMNTRPGTMMVDLPKKSRNAYDIYVGPYSGNYS
jgi:hypothetical protein